jgi:hypothetical protein
MDGIHGVGVRAHERIDVLLAQVLCAVSQITVVAVREEWVTDLAIASVSRVRDLVEGIDEVVELFLLETKAEILGAVHSVAVDPP